MGGGALDGYALDERERERDARWEREKVMIYRVKHGVCMEVLSRELRAATAWGAIDSDTARHGWDAGLWVPFAPQRRRPKGLVKAQNLPCLEEQPIALFWDEEIGVLMRATKLLRWAAKCELWWCRAEQWRFKKWLGGLRRAWETPACWSTSLNAVQGVEQFHTVAKQGVALVVRGGVFYSG